ncbi:carbamate kinase [Xiamenia xianingshaonis]|uniref:Carbamate kinase n=1 Tax=Xiamenia xianingshaonis TaxID=2682776 RepID=A0ABX0IFP5_9ACTN|nr:carbamate kinase [Xiamenia xianingshaonis]NGM18144.1 carbamate kinase [Eggerthellaceae bacterium zg-893]NHM13621.1 carbamate kinase [Xiamenia xianingshaonis]
MPNPDILARVVIALGGNALQSKESDGTADAQLKVVKETCELLAELSAEGYEMAIVHGNGPQVGRILLSSETAKDVVPPMPLEVCGSMSQGYIGYHVQQALKHDLAKRGLSYPVVTMVTQTIVDKEDPSFKEPTKPIGPFYTEQEANDLVAQRGYEMREDKARGGWRRVVASPKPQKIVEIEAVKQLWDSTIVICAGGGGIPVIENADGTLEGVAAVIDKDFGAELLAEEVDADILLILTEVEKVAINFGTPQQQDLDHLTLAEAAQYCEAGQFGKGSMLPKVEACMKFVRSYPSKRAIITSLSKAKEALAGNTGTVFTY